MKSKNNPGSLVALTLFLTLGFLILWEFWLEELLFVNYLEIEVHKNSLDRWTLIVSCLSIVCLSLILPLKSMKNILDEIKSLKTALHGEQALSKVFFSVDNSIILIINNSNKIMQINKKASYLLGFKEDEMLGEDWISLLIEEKSREGLKNQYQQFVKDKNQNFIRFTAAVNAKDGTEKMIDWQCSPLRDENGKIYGSINSGQDISEPIRLRGELSQFKGKYGPYIKKLTAALSFNKKKYHSEAIKSANARSRFKFWFELENTLMGLSPEQIKNPEDIKNRIQKALELFGELSNIEHGYIFKFTPSRSHMINTHLWVSGEPMLEPDREEEISLDNFPWFKKNIQKKEIIHVPKIDAMPKDASSEKEMYLSQGVKSLINVPIIHNDSAVGYIGFESNQKEKKWDNDEISIIKVMARLISSITNPPSSLEPQFGAEIAHSLEKITGIQPETDLPQPSLEKTSEKPKVSKVPAQETKPSIDKELVKVRESFEREFQQKIKSMERTQSQLTSELKEKSLELEKLLAKAGGGSKDKPDTKANQKKPLLGGQPGSPTPAQAKELEEMRNALQKKETELTTLRSQLKSRTGELTTAESEKFKTEISKKDDEIKSFRKSFEEEKSAKTQLQKNLNEVQESITKHKKDIEVLETANQVMLAELEELRKVQEEFFTHSIQLEDTQQELESLGIANEQLMSDIKEKSYLIEESKEKAVHYEQMDLPLFTLDQDGTILSWNQTAESLTGHISELALNQSISFIFAERDSFDFENEFLAPLKKNFKHRLEIPIRKSDGEVFKALISMASFKNRNGIVTTLGYLTNLSDVKNEDEIKSIKKQFATLLGNSGLILVTLSPDYLIFDMSEKAESTFQWNREDTLEKHFFETILPQENWQAVSSDIQKRMNTQDSADLETQTMLSDEIKHSFLWSLAKEIDPEDETVRGFLAVGQDITDLRNAQNKSRESEYLLNSIVDKAVLLEEKEKESQEQFEKTLNEKQYQFKDVLKQSEGQKMALREEKLNMVDHITSSVVDLVNNPIQGIENILKQVKKQAEMADIHKGLITVAVNECRRVADLISRLKGFQPPTKENLESLDVHQILDEVIQNNKDIAKDHTITLERNYAKGLPAVDGVTPQIRQAIDNIVKNAEESLSEDEGKIIISTEQEGSNVKIHIQDTGCGITEADMDRIFDPFFTTKSAIHRPGLGLLASLGIVKNHKGEIDVHSTPGEGTTFTVTLPLKQPLNQNGGS